MVVNESEVRVAGPQREGWIWRLGARAYHPNVNCVASDDGGGVLTTIEISGKWQESMATIYCGWTRRSTRLPGGLSR